MRSARHRLELEGEMGGMSPHLLPCRAWRSAVSTIRSP
jgi:hypothetical protein